MLMIPPGRPILKPPPVPVLLRRVFLVTTRVMLAGVLSLFVMFTVALRACCVVEAGRAAVRERHDYSLCIFQDLVVQYVHRDAHTVLSGRYRYPAAQRDVVCTCARGTGYVIVSPLSLQMK